MKTFALAITVLIFSVATGQKKEPGCIVTSVLFQNNKRTDSSLSRKIFYNKKSQPILEIEYDHEGKPASKTRYRYRDGRMNEKTIHFKEGRSLVARKQTNATDYRYDTNGNVIEEQHSENDRVFWMIKYEYDQSKFVRRQDYSLNSNKRLELSSEEFKFYDEAGNMNRSFIVRDSDTTFREYCTCEVKNVLKCTSYDRENKLYQKWDDTLGINGRVAKRVYYRNDTVHTVVKYTYNATAEPVFKTVEDGSGIISTYEFAYFSSGTLKSYKETDFKDKYSKLIIWDEKERMIFREEWSHDELESRIYYEYK